MTGAALLLALGSVLGPAPRATPPQGPTPAESCDARALLERAAQLRRRLRSARDAQREALLREVLEAYREVGERFPGRRAEVAEAGFRAGELLRSAGATREARAEFERAREHGTGTVFGARAGLELGHLARRAARHEEALVHYRGVLSARDSPPAQRDDALLWAARCSAQLGRFEEARGMLEVLGNQAEDPCDRVAAHDERALVWIACGDLEAAAGELERCRARMRPWALEETPLGARVRSALKRMRAVERLRRAIVRRREGVVVER